MSKTMNLFVPALCVFSAIGLSACDKSEVSTTAQQASTTAAEVQSDPSPTLEPAAAAPTKSERAEAAPQRKEAATEERPARATDRSEREAAALAAREARAREAREARDAKLASGNDRTRRESDAKSLASREASRRSAADIGAASGVAHQEPVILAEPATVDMGDMATGERRTGVVKLTNTSDSVIRILDARSSCGCTVANVPKNYDIQPGETIEAEIALSGGAVQTRTTKSVSFVFEDHPNVAVSVTGNVIAYVSFEPRILDRESNPDGRIVIRSHDGVPFNITGVAPENVVTEVPAGEATEHAVVVDWERWDELRQPRRLEISLDHPKTQKVTASVRSAAHIRPVSRERDSITSRKPAAAPLHELAQRGESDALLEKIKGGADVDSADPRSGTSLLGIAARHGHTDLMKALIEAGADVDFPASNNGVTPLMNAAQSKNAEAVRILIDAGADVNARDTTLSNSALWWAALSGTAETVELLLEAGADASIVNGTGWTPLLAAAGFGEEGAVKLLLEAGGDPNRACQIQGATPAMYAAQTGRVDNLKLLLEHGVDLEAKDNRGRTVLLFAADHSAADAAVIQALIDAGADVRATDPRGMSAMDYAKGRSDQHAAAIIKLLQPYFTE